MKLTSALPKRRQRIVVIPLIDILFFLLAAFMMVSLQMSRTQNRNLNLPLTTPGRPLFDSSSIRIAMDKSGTIWLENRQLTLPEFAARFNDQFKLDAGTRVYVSGDRDTPVEAMNPVLQVVQHAGAKSISFVVGGTTNQVSP
jgi:biopolymer transport protein ExbD